MRHNLPLEQVETLQDVIVTIKDNADNLVDKIRPILNKNNNLLDADWMQGDMGDRPTQRYTLLSYAAACFNLDAVRLLIEEFNVPVNQANQDGETALHLAVLNDTGSLNKKGPAYKTVRYLLSHGANPDISVKGVTPRKHASELADQSRLDDYTKPARDLYNSVVRRETRTPASQDPEQRGLNCEAAFNDAARLHVRSYQLSTGQKQVAAAVLGGLALAATVFLRPN